VDVEFVFIVESNSHNMTEWSWDFLSLTSIWSLSIRQIFGYYIIGMSKKPCSFRWTFSAVCL